MKWLKSPWFWVVLVAALLAIYFLFFRSTGGTTKPSSSVNKGSMSSSIFQGLANQLASIGAKFSVGDTIYSSGGGSG